MPTSSPNGAQPSTCWRRCSGAPNSAARALLHPLLEQGDIVGRDAAGRTIIQLSVNDYVLETLLTFDAEPADLEPQADDEEDGPPVLIELAQPKMVERRRALGSGCG